MTRAENKTKPNGVQPADFIAELADGPRKQDAEKLLAWFEKVTGLKAHMWGASMIGFGRYHYRYDSGREGEAMLTGFSPRKRETVLYIMPGYRFEAMQEKLARLGPHQVGKSCLYIKRLADVDMSVLAEIVEAALLTCAPTIGPGMREPPPRHVRAPVPPVRCRFSPKLLILFANRHWLRG